MIKQIVRYQFLGKKERVKEERNKTGERRHVSQFLKILHFDTCILRIKVDQYKCHLHLHKKKPSFFSHSGFSLEVARQLPINTAKNPNWKTHLRSVVFWNSAGFSLVFCQCKRLLPSHRYYSGFWLRGTWPSAESPAARDVLHTTYGQRQREVAHAHHLPKNQYEIRVFSRMRFSCQKTEKLWVFLAV